MHSLITQTDLRKIFAFRYNNLSATGWGPRLRNYFNYFTPDEYYEAMVEKLITAQCHWLDVGCGRNVFPSNVNLARLLAGRCALLIGVDPDRTIEENSIIHRRVRGMLEDMDVDSKFDLVTLRMVAEHIVDPEKAVRQLSHLTKKGGKVVVYTVNRWSPVSLVSWITPFCVHNSLKQFLWDSEDKDTFPVCYRMNTRREIKSIFEKHGFKERFFEYVSDCRTLERFRLTLILELCCWRIAKFVGFGYPENCLLGVYERV